MLLIVQSHAVQIHGNQSGGKMGLVNIANI